MITLRIDGDPVPQPRPRAYRRGRLHPQIVSRPNGSAAAGWYDYVRASTMSQMRAGKHKPAARRVPLIVTMTFALRRPKSVSKSKRPHPAVTPDLDNLTKLVLDALNKVAWYDDAQIIELLVRKIYSPDPGVEVKIKEKD